MKQLKRFFVTVCFVVILISDVSAQSFPQGSTQGTMQMGNTVQPSQSPSIPNISVEITSPQTGQEVAFSVRLLLY